MVQETVQTLTKDSGFYEYKEKNEFVGRMEILTVILSSIVCVFVSLKEHSMRLLRNCAQTFGI
jgi:hypothetical protein